MSLRASIVIATYNHGHFIVDAVESALAQGPGVEVIVVDDGSTDDTVEVLEAKFGERIRLFRQPHSGASIARNAGLDAAYAPFVCFLDADDVLYEGKIDAQLAAITDKHGWAVCDVLIIDDAKGTRRHAADQYNYRAKAFASGDLAPDLAEANFIPLMSPLIRTSVLRAYGIRFSDGRPPEDWYFWQELAAVARCVYVDAVFAEYRHRTTGRSRLPAESRLVVPNPEHPIRLNLGCGQPGKRSWHPMPGLVNLDPSLPGEWEWRFERGLPRFTDGSVAGITISHALMYLADWRWPAFLAEAYRVLESGGVLRITEDDTEHPKSSRRGGWQGSEPAVALTGPAMARAYLEAAGFVVTDVDRNTTGYRDRSLMQAQHGEAPDVFFIEGRKGNKGVLFSPHNDDETLFAAFTILRHRPAVVVCFGSAGDYGASEVREAETRAAMDVIGGGPVEQWNAKPIVSGQPWGANELLARMRDYDRRERPDVVWAPARLASHVDHVEVAMAAEEVFGDRVRKYHTYATAGKVREGAEVPFEPEWIEQKHRALLRYTSQIRHPRACKFFVDDLREYMEPHK